MLLSIGVALSGIMFATYSAFCCIQRYDDEGVVLLFVQHMLDGHPIYDRVDCLYGPFFMFCRWVVFGVLGLPLGNDALRSETLVTWLVTSLFLAMTVWRLVRGLADRAGITALAWILAMCQLFVLPREPGHPQEVVALLVMAALFIAATMRYRRRRTLMLLGGIGSAILLSKVNVGVFYLLALALSLLALTPRFPSVWFVVKFAVACGTLMLPWFLIKSGIGLGYGGFCGLMTCATLPCLWLACFQHHPASVRVRDLLWCALGAGLVAVSMVAFALWQGNTFGGMVNALYLRTWHNFARGGVGNSLPVSSVALAWDVAAAALGVSSLWRRASWSRVLWPLRMIACLMIVLTAASRNYEVFRPIAFALPLVWLVLVPADGHEPSGRNWFFRLFLALTACLQPLQIFPVAGSQVFIGTLPLLAVAVVLALDLSVEIRDFATSQPLLFARRASLFKYLAVIALAVVSLRPRTYEILSSSWTLPSLTSAWALFAAGLGLVALRFEPSAQKLLCVLKLIVGGGIVVALVTAPPWDMMRLRYAVPLAWLILRQPAGEAIGGVSTYLRLGLVTACCLESLDLLPIVHFIDSPFHFASLAMIAVGAVLLVDVARETRLFDRFAVPWRSFSVSSNIVLLSLSLVIGMVAMIVAEKEYREYVPLDLPGCRWTRMSEREATFCKFLATNVHRSSDSVFARFALESLHFWADQRPASEVVPISNLWSQMDPVSDDRLLQAHYNDLGMMFIDNPNPWNPVPPKMKFLDFIAARFRVIGRIGATRLLVRKDRKFLQLYDCAYERSRPAGSSSEHQLTLCLPERAELPGVATIELVDLDREPAERFLASTSRGLTLADSSGRSLLPSAEGRVDLAGGQRGLIIRPPGSINLTDASFPALRFLDADGRRLLTIPVVLDVPDVVR
jgi:hypothetical protein